MEAITNYSVKPQKQEKKPRFNVVEPLAEPPILKRWKTLSSLELAAHANALARSEKITSVSEFQEKHRSLYNALFKRGMRHLLNIERKYADWPSVSDSELVALAQEKVLQGNFSTPSQLKEAHPGIYKQLKKRGLVEQAGLSPAYPNLGSLPSREVIKQAKAFIKKHNVQGIRELQNTPGGWSWYSELSKRNLLSAVGIEKKIVRWGKRSDHELIAHANNLIGQSQVFTIAELGEKLPRLYQAINTRSKKSPGIWAGIDLLGRGLLSPKSPNALNAGELIPWIGKYVHRDGISTPEGLRACSQMLFLALGREGVDIQKEIGRALCPVTAPKRNSLEAEGIFEKNLPLVPMIVRMRGLNKFISDSEASQLARISIYKSALKWDGRGSFRQYAIKNSVDAWREVHQETEIVHLPAHARSAAVSFSGWMRSNPDGTFEEYVKRRRVSPKIAEGLKRYIDLHGGTLRSTPNSAQGGGEKNTGSHIPGNPPLKKTNPGSPWETHCGPEQEEKVFLAQLKEKVSSLLHRFPERERKMVEMRFGFNGYEVHEFGEIGKKYGISKQAAQQVLSRVLGKLARSREAKSLNEEIVSNP